MSRKLTLALVVKRDRQTGEFLARVATVNGPQIIGVGATTREARREALAYLNAVTRQTERAA